MTETTAPPAALDQTQIDTKVEKLQKKLMNRWNFRMFLLAKLPLALIAGARIRRLEKYECDAVMPYKWLTTNPFKSTYFAALSMAAEMSTGVIAIMAIEAMPAKISMLVTGLEATFVKKATDVTTFTYKDGRDMYKALEQTYATGEPVEYRATTYGKSENGEDVAQFTITWSFKRKS